MRRQGGKGKRRIGAVCSAAGTSLIVIIIILCSLLTLPGIFGFHMYHVISGSMEPKIPVGSLLYVKEGAAEDAKEKDIIAFYSGQDDGSVITHRVVKNNVVSGSIQTKGDANEKEDPTPVAYEYYIGKVTLSVPFVGKLLTLLTSLYGKLAAACVILLGVILNIIGSNIKNA